MKNFQKENKEYYADYTRTLSYKLCRQEEEEKRNLPCSKMGSA